MSPLIKMNWESFKEDLLGTDPQKSLKAVKGLSDRIEIVHSTEYPTLLREGLPAFTTLLLKKSTPDDPLRKSVLDLLSRLPNNEILRKHAPQLMQISMDVLQNDYEDNAVVASRIILDLHKHFRSMQDQVQAYLDFVQASYKALPHSIERNFSSASEATVVPVPTESPISSSASVSSNSSTPMPSLSSFRVLTECPLTVMLLFQLYPKFLKANIPSLISLMMDCLGLRAPPSASTQQSKREHYSRHRELVAAQVKTLSFLTYLLRGFGQDMRIYEDRLAANVVALMQTCPNEALSTRKELLVATRHILATEFRKGFFQYMDQLLDDRVLMGHRFSCESLQPLGYSTMADLVHHVRSLLSVKQLSRVIYMFSRVLHDSSLKLPMTIQITAVRLLLNLVDIIFHSKSNQPNTDPQVGKDMLGRILDTLVNKLRTMRNHPFILQQQRAIEKDGGDDNLWKTNTEQSNEYQANDTQESNYTPEESKDIENDGGISENSKSPADMWMFISNESIDSLRDIQSIVRSIIVGLKTVIWCVNNYHPNKEEDGTKMSIGECDLIDMYILYSLPCMKVFSDNVSQYRDVLAHFGASFTVLDKLSFRQIVGRRIEVLVAATVEDQHVMVVTRHLLGSKMSVDFTHLLLLYLVEHLADLSIVQNNDMVFVQTPSQYWDLAEVEKAQQCAREMMLDMKEDTVVLKAKRQARASTLLEIFERILKSLGSQPENETALRPHLRKVVSSSLQKSMEAFCKDWPDSYCILLRCIFRSISGGKFEESYKELLPLIPNILNGLYRVYQATDEKSLRHTIIELCLTIPARLSSLLPHMSLLLQMIIPSLRSESGDLINLGLRTLEFWIDNLNPEFLFPILSKQSVIFVDLMTSLSNHLQPAPYPYGLLTLRLLGKLGGKNRLFLREPFEQQLPYSSLRRELDILAIDCVWRNTDPSQVLKQQMLKEPDKVTLRDTSNSDSFQLLLPLERAVEILELIASSPGISQGIEGTKEDNEGEFKVDLNNITWAENAKLMELDIDTINLQFYCCDVVEQTKASQARAAFTVISSSLAKVVDVVDASQLDLGLFPSHPNVEESEMVYVDLNATDVDASTISRGSLSIPSKRLQNQDNCFNLIIRGLLIGSAVESISEECHMLLNGLSCHFLFIAATHGAHLTRIDANGCQILGQVTLVDTSPEQNELDEKNPGGDFEGQQKIKPRAPFGYFELSGPLHDKIDLFAFNTAIGSFLRSQATVSDELLSFLIANLLETSEKLKNGNPNHLCLPGIDALHENLLSMFCCLCSSLSWNRSSIAFKGLLLLLSALGMDWSQQFELEIMHASILAIKKCVKEIPFAGVKAFQLFAEICSRMYGQPSKWATVDEDSTMMIRDATYLPSEITGKGKQDSSAPASKGAKPRRPSDEVQQIFINELTSTSHIVRIAMRFVLKHFVLDTMPDPKFEFAPKLPLIKRVLFTRSLRLLPLPEQIGVIEALGFVVDCIPGLISISDQQLVGLLSEFLKMASIVDGEMTDSSIIAQFADKNGYTASTQGGVPASANLQPNILLPQASSIFLRQECVARSGNKGIYFIIPEELPNGIQLRVSALRMFRALIRRHADDFFDAEASTPVGNIRPHVISLLFRSLVSSPTQAVIAAYEALVDVLASSVTHKETEPAKSQSRLPKELLQTCIRPVLLNLREYSKLSVPLLRGLAKLLSLLSSWFNKALGEKLLEHLTKWTEPDRIIAKNIWRVGQEPVVAASILDLFSLLPHASHFVENLVKTTIKLEAVLPRYMYDNVSSPYMTPLSRYLNKHCSATVGFFFHRLKNPMYSELFHDIVLHDESSSLRKHLSGRQCSITLLNVCFERPLAIIRSEKTPSGSNGHVSTPTKSVDTLVMHGVTTEASCGKQVDALRRDIEVKQKGISNLQQDATRTKEALQARSSSTVLSHGVLEEAKRKHFSAQAALDRGQKELNESKQRYAAEVAQPKNADLGIDSSRRMSGEALELQLQGFCLTESLIRKDNNYLKDHNDVIRAFRWLWRSKGRHIRLQHEESMAPRFHHESKQLASFLVSYAKKFPDDVDVLFELLRIFLQPTTADFNFVKNFLVKTVSELSVEKKKLVVQRFFALMAGEGPEETKVLSIHLIIFPMIKSLLIAVTGSPNLIINDLNKEKANKGTLKENYTLEPNICVERNEVTNAEVVDASMVSKFVKEILFKDGLPAFHGDRLRVELLRLSTLLLEYNPIEIEDHKKDIIKFAWNLLKSDDLYCKNWAYLNVCRFISAFNTPANIVMQVYIALLRAFQLEGRDLVRASVSILVPSLQRRLENAEFDKAMQYTNKVLCEEGNSIPHIAHIWQIIVTHAEVFRSQRHHFTKHIINSVNRLGLPPSCPIENRVLSLRLIELVLDWQVEIEVPISGKPPESELNELETETDRSEKSDSNAFFASKTGAEHIDTIANFLVRMKILLADAKTESNPQNLDLKATKLLQRVILRWDRCNIRPIYFEKVVAMCRDDTASSHRLIGSLDSADRRGKESEKSKVQSKSLAKSNKSSVSKSSQASITRDDPKTVQTPLLLACLDIFIVLVDNGLCHSFLSQNSSVVTDILEPCFTRAFTRDGRALRERIKHFLVPALTLSANRLVDIEFNCRINSLLESFILESTFEVAMPVSSIESTKASDISTENSFSCDDNKLGGSCIAFFSLDIIQTVGKTFPSFIDTFTVTIVALAEKLTKLHATESPPHVRQATLTHQRGYLNHITPTAANIDFLSKINIVGRKEEMELKLSSGVDSGPNFAVDRTAGTSIRSLVTCLRLVGSSRFLLSFSKERKKFLEIVRSIFESCNSVHVVLESVRLVGGWLLVKNGSSLLTAKERSCFLWKLASIDYNTLPPVVFQPVADLVAAYLAPSIMEHQMNSNDFPSESCHLPQRIVTACLLQANELLRADILSLFISSLDTDKGQGGTSTNGNVITLLWNLLHCDFECLGRRLWTIAFTDVLLECATPMSSPHSNPFWLSLPTVDQDLDAQTSIEKMVPSYRKFSSFIYERQVNHEQNAKHCMDATRILAHGDEQLSQNLFETVISSCWKSLMDNRQRLSLVKPFERLMARSYHAQHLKQTSTCKSGKATNVIQSLVRIVSILEPMPMLDVDLLVSLATSYKVWHQILDIFTVQYEVTLSNTGFKDEKVIRSRLLSAIGTCLSELCEENLKLGVAMQSCLLLQTKWAASLHQQGSIKDSVSAYENLMTLAETIDERSNSVAPTDYEMDHWETQWIHLQRELCQVDVVATFADATTNHKMMLECACQSQQWDKVKDLHESPAIIALTENGDLSVKLSEILVAISENKLSEVENLHAQTAQLALSQWQLLPTIALGSPAHSSLLHFFHRLVELRESGQIMVETKSNADRRTLPDLKNLLSAWRHRLPNEHDRISQWDEVFSWRMHMFRSITSNFSWSEPNTLASLHDRPWTYIQMAKVARKQGLREVALQSLNQLTDCSMDVSDAFSKLREQILAFSNPDSDLERTGGLNLINTTNLAFFDASQKSELFRLKAKFLSSLGGRSKSNQSFCHAIQVSPSHARAWVSWGGLCASLGKLAEKQTLNDGCSVKTGAESKEVAPSKKVAQYLAQGMGCFLEAVQCDPNDWARAHLSKCLWMLSKDGSEPGVLCLTFETRGAALPEWVWLPWIPQLLTGLYRNEGRATKAILNGLVKSYPQALYFSLRAFYLERRDVERNIGPSSAGHLASVVHSEELMSALRRAHASLWSSLEAILEELIVKFRPSYEEELLATITALLERAESQTDYYIHTEKKESAGDDEEAIVASVSKTLGRISSKFFRDAPPVGKVDERAKRTAIFSHKYKSLFENDFLEKCGEEKERKIPLSDFLSRLKKWRSLLVTQVSITPLSLPLVESSLSLAMFAAESPDLWAMSCSPRYPVFSNTNKDRLREPDCAQQPSTSSSAIAAKTTSLAAAIAVAKAAASEGCGGEYGGGSASIEIPGQYAPNITSATDLKPSQELHAKLIRFEAVVCVIRRNEQLVRRIGLMGSDGRCYRFLLQFAIPYWTRTDERTTQVHYILDKVLRKDMMSSRKFLSLRPTPVIPIAQRLRLTAEYENRMSLDDVFRNACEKLGQSFDYVSQSFHCEIMKELNAKKFRELEGEDKANLEVATKLMAFNRICSTLVDSNVLLDFIRVTTGDAENLFHYRRSFAGQLAINSMLQHVFSVAERTPSRVVFNQCTGQVFAPDFRFSYNNQGFLDEQRVPFRLTRNLRELIGHTFEDGRFIPAMATFAAAVKNHLEELDPVLKLLMRDDIIAWYTSKSMAKSDSKTQELEKQLHDRVLKNVSSAQIRIVECSPRRPPKDLTPDNLPTDPVDKKVRSLIKEATNKENLCQMLPNFQPWL